jgi:hypothetical protein
VKKLLFTLPFVIALTLPLQNASANDSLLNTLKGVFEKVQEGGVTAVSPAALTADDLIAGLKEALRVGTERVASQLGAADGYLMDPKVHIPLPDGLLKVQALLRKVGLSALADDVETRLNRAAESAAPKTKELFWKAINAMTLDDARRIYDGPEDAATRYFEKVSSVELRSLVRPVVEQALQEAGAVNAYDQLLGQYQSLPFVPNIRGDLTSHATDKALEGLFHYLAVEEAAIRKDPVKRTTEILQKVFAR